MAISVFHLSLLLAPMAIGQQSESKDTLHSRKAQHTVYAEWWGNSLGLSANYDYCHAFHSQFKYSLRIGITPTHRYTGHELSHRGTGLRAPAEINILYGNKSHIELGLGMTLGFHAFNEVPRQWEPARIITEKHFFLRVGYRIQRPQGGVFFRFGLLGTYYNFENWYYRGPYLRGSAALGYTFRNQNKAK
jgi:hypothetical protein